MPKKNFSISSSNIGHCFWLFIILLLLTLGLHSYNYINLYLTQKKKTIIDIATNLQQRIDNYRYHTYQNYDIANNIPQEEDRKEIKETRLRPDIFYIEKLRKKTDSVIFGSHERTTLNMTVRMSDYLDSHWGPQTETYSMYYLNGQDNNLILITTQSLKELTSRFKESYLTASAESRRIEMLQQANTLDERESFSPLRKLRFQNAYYFTIRTTFNHPGHLATVIAFDLPVNDLIPVDMARANFSLEQIPHSINESRLASYDTIGATITINGSWLEFSAPLANAPLKIVYHVSLNHLAVDLTRNNFWLILTNIFLLSLSIVGIYFIRLKYVNPSNTMAEQLINQRSLNQLIVTNLPLGLLVYDFNNNSVITSNKIAEHLLSHLNLQKIANMAEKHHGVIQATVNNEAYEVRMFRSQLSPEIYLFLLQDQDKEVMVNKRLQQAQAEYDKNLQARKLILHNLGNELNQPLNSLNHLVHKLPNAIVKNQQSQLIINQLIDESDSVLSLINDITLLTRLEMQDWQPKQLPFSLSALINEVLLEALPAINKKGLSLFNYFQIGLDLVYTGDEQALRKVLSLLLRYAIITTAYGKISLKVEHESGNPEQLVIHITDTGAGISAEEMNNLNYPFLSKTLVDRYNKGSGLTFFLCNQLCKKLNGQLDIHSKPDIGTHYTIRIAMMVQMPVENEEKLLDGTTALLDITSTAVRGIITTLLNMFGADCIIADDRRTTRDYDVLITDDPQRYDRYTLLLTSDELGLRQLQKNYIRVNYNLNSTVIDAILLLIEQKILDTEQNIPSVQPVSNDTDLYGKQLKSSGYYTLFIETVPVDLKRLYTAAEHGDFVSLSQIAHRLKGVFAMLNQISGKELCETLEQHVANGDLLKTKNSISELDSFINRLLHQGNSQYE